MREPVGKQSGFKEHLNSCVVIGTEEYWNKIARLDTKLVNILQGNKAVTIGAHISTN